MSWVVRAAEDGSIHVVPCDGSGVQADPSHVAVACWCQPKLERNGPLDDPVVSHNEPAHPGAKVGLS